MATTHDAPVPNDDLRQKFATEEKGPALWPPIVTSFAVGFGFLMLAKYLPFEWEKRRELTVELGIAFLVAGVLAITIDGYMSRQKKKEDRAHEQKVERNVFLALFQTALPPKLVNEMYEMLFTKSFLREELNILITLRNLSEKERRGASDSNLLVLNQTVTYKARNITDKTADHHFRPREYTLVPHEKFSQLFRNFTVTDLTSKTPPERLFPDDSKSKVTKDPDGIWYNLSLEKKAVPENHVLEVVSEIEMVCRDTDIKTWLTYYPAEKLTLKVDPAPDLQDALEFAVDQSHRCDLVPNHTTGSDGRKHYEWKLDKPILPYQGVVLYWKKKP